MADIDPHSAEENGYGNRMERERQAKAAAELAALRAALRGSTELLRKYSPMMYGSMEVTNQIVANEAALKGGA